MLNLRNELAKGIEFSQEFLGRVMSVKNWIRHMRSAGGMNQIEFEQAQKQISMLEGMARNMIRDREARYERAGGLFMRPENIRSEFYTKK